jgi:hypothetical protein
MISRPCSKHGNEDECIRSFGGKASMKVVNRKTYRWEDNIKIYLREIVCGSMK